MVVFVWYTVLTVCALVKSVIRFKEQNLLILIYIANIDNGIQCPVVVVFQWTNSQGKKSGNVFTILYILQSTH